MDKISPKMAWLAGAGSVAGPGLLILLAAYSGRPDDLPVAAFVAVVATAIFLAMGGALSIAVSVRLLFS